MLLKINSENPEGRKIQQVVASMMENGVIIYPTDTIYGLGADMSSSKGIDRICRLRNLDPAKAMLSLICKDISQVAEFAHQIDNQVFRLMKKNLPGPFTFILKSNNKVPKLFRNRKRTIGIRIPSHPVPIGIVEALGRPMVSASLKSEDEIREYFTDPTEIYDDFSKKVDILIDSGNGTNVPSTIVDCTGDQPVVIREGAGALQW